MGLRDLFYKLSASVPLCFPQQKSLKNRKKKLRLMQITHDLAIGGLQQVVVNICRTIDREKFDISVLCLRNLGEFVPEIEKLGIKVLFLPQKETGTDYLSFLKVAKILREEKIDIIHTHNTQPFIDGTIGAIMSGVKTIVHTDHARAFPDKRRYMIAERFLSRFAYRVVGVSEKTSDDLMKYEKISPRKIMTIPNGIDGNRFKIKVDREKKKKELGLTTEGPVIGLASRLTSQKGIPFLLRAMSEILAAIPDAVLIIAGEGRIEDELKKEALDLQIADHVRFIGPRMDMPELLKLFDLYVMPSLWEGLPMVLLEAMAAGCPIVSTNVGGIGTAIQHGINGSLVNSQDSDALAKEIVRVLKDKELRSKYVANGLDIFEKQFSASKMTRQYEKLYLREI